MARVLAEILIELKSQCSFIIFLVMIILVINIILWVQVVKIKNIVKGSAPKTKADKRLEKTISKKKFKDTKPERRTKWFDDGFR